MNSLKTFLQSGDKFANHSGIELVSVEPGRGVARMAVQPWHLNSVGIVHGGAIFALGDFAFAAASNSHGTVAVGINVSISYVNAAKGGVLTAEACEVACNPKLASYTVNVTDAAGQLVAVFQGLVYRKKDAMPPAGGKGRNAE